MNYEYKYNKYKLKYNNIKNLIGGMNIEKTLMTTITNNKDILEKIKGIGINKLKDEVTIIKKKFESDTVTRNVLLLEYGQVIQTLLKNPFDKKEYDEINDKYNRKRDIFIKFKKTVENTTISDSDKKQFIQPVKLTQPINLKNDPDKWIDCIAVKDGSIIDKKSLGYLGDLGKQTKLIKINDNCKDIFNIENNTWCYFFVSLKCDMINTLNKIKYEPSEIETVLKNILGMRKEWGPYKYVISLQVQAKNLIRPCLDNDINKDECRPVTPTEINKTSDGQYKSWFLKWFNSSHKLNIPFTGLGYSYNINDDMTKTQPYGVSEYVIIPHSDIKINHIYTINEYIEQVRNICKK
jgi:hypothetical protein